MDVGWVVGRVEGLLLAVGERRRLLEEFRHEATPSPAPVLPPLGRVELRPVAEDQDGQEPDDRDDDDGLHDQAAASAEEAGHGFCVAVGFLEGWVVFCFFGWGAWRFVVVVVVGILDCFPGLLFCSFSV